MIHPRELYIRACVGNNKSPAKDYFLSRSLEDGAPPILFLGSGDKLKVATLTKFLVAGVGPEPLSTAFSLFLDLNMRITLDGLLLYKPFDEVRKLRNIKSSTLTAYCDYFFNPAVFASADGSDSLRDVFYSLVQDEAAQVWFKLCSKKSFAELDFMLNGALIINKDTMGDLQKIRSKATANYLSFGDFPEGAMLSGLPVADRARILLAQKEASIAIKTAQVEMQSTDMLGDLKKFLKEMKIEVEEDSVDSFARPDLSPEALEAIEMRAKSLRAIAAEKSDIPDDDLDDGE
jgi:hypothetical protein